MYFDTAFCCHAFVPKKWCPSGWLDVPSLETTTILISHTSDSIKMSTYLDNLKMLLVCVIKKKMMYVLWKKCLLSCNITRAQRITLLYAVHNVCQKTIVWNRVHLLHQIKCNIFAGFEICWFWLGVFDLLGTDWGCPWPVCLCDRGSMS